MNNIIVFKMESVEVEDGDIKEECLTEQSLLYGVTERPPLAFNIILSFQVR